MLCFINVSSISWLCGLGQAALEKFQASSLTGVVDTGGALYLYTGYRNPVLPILQSQVSMELLLSAAVAVISLL